MRRDKIDSAVRDAVEDHTGKPTGLSQPPSREPDMNVGYVIIYQSPSPPPEGSWKDPEECKYFDYLIKSVGRSHRQVAWIQGAVQDAMTGRDTGGGYMKDITISGFKVIDRRTVSGGGIIQSDEHVFEGSDIYRLKVMASGE